MVSRYSDTVSDLTNPGIEPQTSRTDSDVLIQNVKIKSSLSSENQTYSYTAYKSVLLNFFIAMYRQRSICHRGVPVAHQ